MENRLDHFDEFVEILSTYKVSDEGKEMLKRAKLACLVGPTSAGRNTLINGLLKTGEYHQIISDTTRNIRVNDGKLEQNGVEYWFKTEEDVLSDLKAGLFLEAALIHNQQVSGTSLRELKKATNQDKVAINEIQIDGMRNIIGLKPDAKAFFVVPPGFRVWMERLEKRGILSEDEKQKRLSSALKEFEAALNCDYYTFVVNDNLEVAMDQIHKHAIEGEVDPENDRLGREVTQHLLRKTKERLR